MQEKVGNKSILKYILSLIVLTLVLGQFNSIIQIGGSKLYLFDLLISFFVIYGFGVLFISKKKVFIDKAFFPFTVFILYSCLILFVSLSWFYSSDVLLSAYYLYRIILYFLASLIVYNMFRQNIIDTYYVKDAFVYSAFLLAIMGFVQLIVLPDFETLDPSLGWDPHKNRLASTFFDPNFAGVYLSMALGVLMFLKSKVKYKSLIFITLLLALFLTFSRSAWLMFGFIVFVYGLTKNFYIILLSGLLAFSAYYAVPRIQTRLSGVTDPKDSASLRIISWQNALEIIYKKPLTGWGYNNYRLVQKDLGLIDYDELDSHSVSGADSSLLLLVATTGVIGLLIFALSIFSLLYKVEWSYSIFLLAITGGIFLNSQFINSLFYPQIMFWWMIYLFSFRVSDM